MRKLFHQHPETDIIKLLLKVAEESTGGNVTTGTKHVLIGELEMRI